MAFRSDRQALVQRVEALKREVREFQAASEAEVARRREELAQLESQLAGMPADRSAVPAGLLLGLGVAVFALAGAGAYLMLLRAGPEPAPVVVVQEAPVPVVPVEVPAPLPPPAPPPPSPPPADPHSRPQPTRTEVAAAFAEARDDVLRCASGQQGTVAARVTFAGATGRVSAATVVSPPFAGTPAGSCMARVLRQMRLEPFENPSLTVTFPYVVR